MKIVTTIVITLAVAALFAIGFALSGLYDPAATSPHNDVVGWLLNATSRASAQRRARNIDVPDLTDDQLVLSGASDYDAMCAVCHGAPGQDPEAVGQGLNPPPPDLAESARHMTAAELFWVTKHGIRMSGMPAWGPSHSDEDLWSVVALVARLPELNAKGYQELLERGKGMGHHSRDSHGDERDGDRDSDEDAHGDHDHNH
jgi:mono/diheme cytochrome c family protein